MRGIVIGAVVTLALAGCTSSECDSERIPERGHARTPDALAVVVQHEAKHECWGELYDLLSAKTRDRHSRIKWRIGVSSIRVPAPYDYKVVDVMTGGTWVGALEIAPTEAFAYYDYQEPGKKPLKLKLLILNESGEWRVGLEDQKDHIEAGRGAYWWFDE